MLPNIELDNPLEGPPTGAIIRGNGKGKDEPRKSRKKTSMERRRSRERSPIRNSLKKNSPSRILTPSENEYSSLSENEYSSSSKNKNSSSSGFGRRRSRSLQTKKRGGYGPPNSPLRAMPSNLYENLVTSPGGYYSPPGSPRSPGTPSAN
jgi:hypothetical protein